MIASPDVLVFRTIDELRDECRSIRATLDTAEQLAAEWSSIVADADPIQLLEAQVESLTRFRVLDLVGKVADAEIRLVVAVRDVLAAEGTALDRPFLIALYGVRGMSYADATPVRRRVVELCLDLDLEASTAAEIRAALAGLVL